VPYTQSEKESGGGLLPPAPGKTEEMPGAAGFGLGTASGIGRPFLNTTKAIIYIGTGEIHFHFRSKKVRRFFNDNYIISEEPKKNKSKRRQRTHRQNKKNVIVDGWADYEGEVTRFEDQEKVTEEVEEIQLVEEKVVECLICHLQLRIGRFQRHRTI
jgi:hypothetical protein